MNSSYIYYHTQIIIHTDNHLFFIYHIYYPITQFIIYFIISIFIMNNYYRINRNPTIQSHKYLNTHQRNIPNPYIRTSSNQNH